MVYHLTTNDLQLIEDFVKRSSRDHLSYGRSYKEIEDDIRCGKAGEIAFKNWFPEHSEIDWSGRVQTDGLDFTDPNGKGVQVKTLRADTRWCTFSDWKWDRLAIIRESNGLHLIGVFDRDQVRRFARPSKWRGFYVDPNQL